MDSIWSDNIKYPSFPSLTEDTKTDVLIIGGGITGILCAYMLKNAGVDCLIAEADKICSGITKNTTAKITLQHGLIYEKIIKTYGIETADGYLRANMEAMEKYKSICSDIDCDYKECDSFVYSLVNRMKIEQEIRALEKLNFRSEFISKLPLPFSVSGAIKIKNQAQFHPLKFLLSISKELKIYENTKVLKITPDHAITNRGKIFAKKIIVASHFPFINSHGGYFLKMYQHRSYVIALKNGKDLNGMYVDENDKGMSFRNYGNYILIGGGSHRTGKQGGGWYELEKFAKRYYPSYPQLYRWATQDCMTLDKIPYIGKYSYSTPNLFVASGFNKWGMTSSMVSAMILSDMVLEKKNPYSFVFSPLRNIIHPQLAVNIFHSTVGLLTPSVPRCTHLGCALKYNKQEHSWDCSCHGSRYDKNGKIIDNPALKDKEKI